MRQLTVGMGLRRGHTIQKGEEKWPDYQCAPDFEQIEIVPSSIHLEEGREIREHGKNSQAGPTNQVTPAGNSHSPKAQGGERNQDQKTTINDQQKSGQMRDLPPVDAVVLQ